MWARVVSRSDTALCGQKTWPAQSLFMRTPWRGYGGQPPPGYSALLNVPHNEGSIPTHLPLSRGRTRTSWVQAIRSFAISARTP